MTFDQDTPPKDASTPQLLTDIRDLAERIPSHDDARLLFEVAKRLERTEADYGLAVREIDRVDKLQAHGMTHADAWALVAAVHAASPSGKTPAAIYEYLRSIRADPPDEPALDTPAEEV